MFIEVLYDTVEALEPVSIPSRQLPVGYVVQDGLVILVYEDDNLLIKFFMCLSYQPSKTGVGSLYYLFALHLEPFGIVFKDIVDGFIEASFSAEVPASKAYLDYRVFPFPVPLVLDIQALEQLPVAPEKLV